MLVGVTARSLAPAKNSLAVTQFRALAIIDRRRPLHLAARSDAMQVHPSKATRSCDQLVATGQGDRRDNPADRRHLSLTLINAGRESVDGVVNWRARDRADSAHMPSDDRVQLISVLSRFAAAGREPDDTEPWAVGWTTETTPSQRSEPDDDGPGAP